jgi:hypothetical protein
MSHKVKYSDFDPSRLIFGKTDEANATGQDGKPIKYFRIPIQYNYEMTTSDGRKTSVKGPLYIEGPKEMSRGPQTKVYAEKGNKEVHSVFTKYDLTNPEQYKFINRDEENPGTIHKLCLECCKEVFNRKGELGVACRQLASMEDLLFYPVKWTLGNDGRPTGENPAAIWKLFRYGTPPNIRETSFILPVNGGQKISWDMIKDSRIEHQAVFKIDNITIAGGRPTIKIEMASSVIHDIMASGGPNLQADTIAEASKDEYVTAKLLDKIRELEMALSTKGGISETPAPVAVQNEKPLVPVVIPGIVTQEPIVQAVVPQPQVQETVVQSIAPQVQETPTLSMFINSPPIALPSVTIPPPLPSVSIPPVISGGVVIPPLP